MENYIHIGKIVATFGVKGELIVQHALNKKTTLKNIEAVFIEAVKGSYLPFFLQLSKAKNDQEILIQVESVNSKEQAHRFLHKNVWLLETDFRKIVGNYAAINLLGYLVFNGAQSLSVVEEVIEQTHQVLLKITLQNKEVLLPMHSETLVSIDKKKKQVHLSLPDGLLEIYLHP